MTEDHKLPDTHNTCGVSIPHMYPLATQDDAAPPPADTPKKKKVKTKSIADQLGASGGAAKGQQSPQSQPDNIIKQNRQGG